MSAQPRGKVGHIDDSGVALIHAAAEHQRRMQPPKTVDEKHADTDEWDAQAARIVEWLKAKKTTTTDGITFEIKPGVVPTVERVVTANPDSLPTDPEKLAELVLKAWRRAKDSSNPPEAIEACKRLGAL